MSVRKIKACRGKADVAEEDLKGWLDKEAADEWATIGALGRNEAWENASDNLLTSDLRKAREIICWLAKGVWPGGRLLGKNKKQVRVADGDQAVKVIKGPDLAQQLTESNYTD